MGNFFKRIFTWWNGATFGTLLSIRSKGVKVGEDDYGNTYFEEKKVGYEGRKRRWVTYKGYADASRIPAEWHGWLHHMYNELPYELSIKTHDWEKPHHPNLTGTLYAYRPKGSLERGGQRAKITGDYEAWNPDA